MNYNLIMFSSMTETGYEDKSPPEPDWSSELARSKILFERIC